MPRLIEKRGDKEIVFEAMDLNKLYEKLTGFRTIEIVLKNKSPGDGKDFVGILSRLGSIEEVYSVRYDGFNRHKPEDVYIWPEFIISRDKIEKEKLKEWGNLGYEIESVEMILGDKRQEEAYRRIGPDGASGDSIFADKKSISITSGIGFLIDN